MTIDEINCLMLDNQRNTVRDNLACDPLRVAINPKVEHAALVASQVKYLQRARKKLPSYYAAQCIIPSLAFEQSSSEECAAHKSYRGKLCLDLTCGLGVDSLYLSRQFERVIAIERDPALAHLARINFALLGVHNIEVVATTAEEFLADNIDLCPDLIYSDPDRRGTDGRKKVCMEDCSPDVVGLMPLLTKMSGRVVVKCSPLFDVDRGFALFGVRNNTRVEVVSLGGECKEVIIDIDATRSAPQICATALGVGAVSYPAQRDRSVRVPRSSEYRYLVVPDVALLKARVAVDYYTCMGADIASDNGFAFSDTPLEQPLGKQFEIERMEHYTPKKLKKQLRSVGVTRLNILRREFVQPASVVARELGVGEAGERYAAFTTIGKEPIVIFFR